METITDDMRADLKQACQVLEEGGVILYPTDTVWGIGCDATNAEAVERVYRLKQRADSKAMLILVDSAVKVDYYVTDVPSIAWDLIELTTRPLTLIYSGARHLAPNLIAADGSIGIRVTRETFSHALCQRFRRAIVSTSANIAGAPTPQRFADIDPRLLAAADYVCRSRRNETQPSQPSSIIKIEAGGLFHIIRP